MDADCDFEHGALGGTLFRDPLGAAAKSTSTAIVACRRLVRRHLDGRSQAMKPPDSRPFIPDDSGTRRCQRWAMTGDTDRQSCYLFAGLPAARVGQHHTQDRRIDPRDLVRPPIVRGRLVCAGPEDLMPPRMTGPLPWTAEDTRLKRHLVNSDGLCQLGSPTTRLSGYASARRPAHQRCLGAGTSAEPESGGGYDP